MSDNVTFQMLCSHECFVTILPWTKPPSLSCVLLMVALQFACCSKCPTTTLNHKTNKYYCFRKCSNTQNTQITIAPSVDKGWIGIWISAVDQVGLAELRLNIDIATSQQWKCVFFSWIQYWGSRCLVAARTGSMSIFNVCLWQPTWQRMKLHCWMSTKIPLRVLC